MEKDQDGVMSQDAPEGTIARLSAGASCSGCYFYRLADCHKDDLGGGDVDCNGGKRPDGKTVIFTGVRNG